MFDFLFPFQHKKKKKKKKKEGLKSSVSIFFPFVVDSSSDGRQKQFD